MTNEDLADEVISRLNALLKDEDVRQDIERLVKARIECSEATLNHDTIQAHEDDGKFTLGLLGLLNGIVGTIPCGGLKGWGYIGAWFDDEGRLTHFVRTDSTGKKSEG